MSIILMCKRCGGRGFRPDAVDHVAGCPLTWAQPPMQPPPPPPPVDYGQWENPFRDMVPPEGVLCFGVRVVQYIDADGDLAWGMDLAGATHLHAVLGILEKAKMSLVLKDMGLQ